MSSWKSMAVGVLACGALVLALAWRISAPGPAQKVRPAPSFHLTDLQGHTRSLSSLRGHPTLVNFWATWCPPCRAELPEVEALAQSHPHCLQVLGVAMESGGPAQVASFAKRFHLSYPIVLDDGRTGEAYGVRAIPRSVLIDAQGRWTRTFQGKITRAEIQRALATLPAPIHGSC